MPTNTRHRMNGGTHAVVLTKERIWRPKPGTPHRARKGEARAATRGRRIQRRPRHSLLPRWKSWVVVRETPSKVRRLCSFQRFQVICNTAVESSSGRLGNHLARLLPPITENGAGLGNKALKSNPVQKSMPRPGARTHKRREGDGQIHLPGRTGRRAHPSASHAASVVLQSIVVGALSSTNVPYFFFI